MVQALDAVTGDILWQYRKRFERSPDDSFRARTRSIAIYHDKIYLNTNDAHIVALDARTGDVVWDHVVADNALGYRYTSGPIVVNGKIVAGMTGCERYKDGTCFISAHDPQTGAELWRTSTIAQPGEPGGDTWGDLPATFRAGGDAWIPGSYDPATNRTYWSTSQAKPWARLSRGTDGDALYTNSVLALEPETGAIDWYYQFVPGETHDLDDVFESVLIDHRGRQSLFKMGKLGILWELDRKTGAFVAAHDLGYQTLVDVDPETGEATYRPEMIPKPGEELEFCPDFQGIRNWRASAYHPGTGLLYIPIHPTCVKGTFSPVAREPHPTGDLYYYGNPRWTGWQSAGRLPHPKSPDHDGHLVAMDIDTGEVALAPLDAPPLARRRPDDGGRPRGDRRRRPLPLHPGRGDRRRAVPRPDALPGARLPDHLRGRRPAVHRHPGRRRTRAGRPPTRCTCSACRSRGSRVGSPHRHLAVPSLTPSADGYGRLARQAPFAGELDAARDCVLIGDFVGQGDTLASLRGWIETRGARVVGAVGFTGKSYSARWNPTREQLNALRRKHGSTLAGWWWERFGHAFDCPHSIGGSVPSPAPRTLTPSEVELLRRSKREMARVARETLASRGGINADSDRR